MAPDSVYWTNRSLRGAPDASFGQDVRLGLRPDRAVVEGLDRPADPARLDHSALVPLLGEVIGATGTTSRWPQALGFRCQQAHPFREFGHQVANSLGSSLWGR